MFLITKSVPSIIIIPIGRQISQFFKNPAITYATRETAAAVSAYGSWVETW
jgi:hypothetical protein